MNSLLAIVAAYLLGSVSFAVVVSRLFGLADPRSFGSGNPGATNVLRTGNKKAAILVLLGDALKGFFAVYLAQSLASQFGLDNVTIALVAVAVFLGHLFPLWHRFKGGKGVATAAGVLFALNPWLGLATLVTWAVIAFFFRYSSLAALLSAVFAPIYYVFLFGTKITALAVMFISMMLIWRHAANIGRLLAGKETRIGGAASSTGKPSKPGNASGRKSPKKSRKVR